MTEQRMGNLTVERLRTFTSNECEKHGVTNESGFFWTFDEIWAYFDGTLTATSSKTCPDNDTERNEWLKKEFGKCYYLNEEPHRY